MRQHVTRKMSPTPGEPAERIVEPQSRDSGPTRDLPRGNAAEGIAIGLLVAICLLYLALVPLGQWQADEYDRFSHLGQGVWKAFVTRMFWTLRPWEALFIAYGLVVNHFHRPLTGWFLGVLWAGFLFCASAGALNQRGERRFAILLSGLALAAAFLTSGPLFQLFYWPVATVVYLPILSATLLLFVHTIFGGVASPRGRLICGACLVAAAFGGELGATFVIGYAMLQALNALFRRPNHSESGEIGGILYWLLPGLLAVAVIAVASLHRLNASEGFFTVVSPELHHPAASAIAAIRSLALELVGIDVNTTHKWLAVPRLLSKLLLAAGVALVWLKSAQDIAGTRRQISVIGLAFLAATLAVLFGSYLHFGTSAGERLENLRRGWILMAYVAAAILIVQCSGIQRLAGVRGVWFAGPMLILAGVLIPWHVSPLIRQYATYKNVACTTAANFEAGFRTDTDAMIFGRFAANGVITPLELTPGMYIKSTNGGDFNAIYAQFVMEYFRKKNLLVVPARPCDAPVTGQPAP